MDQAISTARDTAAFARRVVLRTLTVVGGAAAGTALAWCLSTASASADTTTPDTPEVPVVSTIVSPVTGALEPALDPIADRLQDPPPVNSVEELGERVKQAVGTVREHAEDQLPECADPLCGLDQLGRSEAPALGDGAGSGRSDSPSPAPAAAPRAAGKVATPGVDPDATAERTATGRAYSDGMPRRGSPAPGMPSLPDFPTWPLPLAPAGPAPAPGHQGSAGSQGDSSPFAALPWQDRRHSLVCGVMVPTTEVATPGRIGAQPGVTPD